MLDFLGWAKDHNEKAARAAATVTAEAAPQVSAGAGVHASSAGSGSAAPGPPLPLPPLQPFGIYGMDLYSLFESQREVVRYLRSVDPALGDRVKRMFEW